MKIPVIGLARIRMHRVLAAGCFAALCWGGVWPVLAPFRPAATFPTIAQQQRNERAELRCFAEGVLVRTPPRASILFLVPAEDADGGLVNHRLRYVLPGRQVVNRGSANYIAAWHQAPGPGQLVWTGCGGALVRP